MSTLILTLPLRAGPAAPEYDFVLTPDGQQISSHGRAAASMLPAKGGRGASLVALVPAQALSWQRIALPDAVRKSVLSGRMETARVRSVLAGVLEERLLDDAERLHFAVFAAPATPPGDNTNTWVAVCDRGWLNQCLQALQNSGHTVDRIVAECTPLQAGPARIALTDHTPPAQMQICTPHGVSLLPWQDASIRLAQSQPDAIVRAEPAVMALAQSALGNQVTLQTRSQRLLEAAQSPWNLAQLEWAPSRGGHVRRTLGNWGQQVLQAPQWRPARAAALALVLVQLVALNAMAWHERSQLDQQRASLRALLQQTFPDVQLVIDAPLQMQRAVDDLARSRGVTAQTHLPTVLALLGPLLPKETVLTSIDLAGAQLRLGASGLTAERVQTIAAALAPHALHARLSDGALLIEPREAR